MCGLCVCSPLFFVMPASRICQFLGLFLPIPPHLRGLCSHNALTSLFPKCSQLPGVPRLRLSISEQVRWSTHQSLWPCLGSKLGRLEFLLILLTCALSCWEERRGGGGWLPILFTQHEAVCVCVCESREIQATCIVQIGPLLYFPPHLFV